MPLLECDDAGYRLVRPSLAVRRGACPDRVGGVGLLSRGRLDTLGLPRSPHTLDSPLIPPVGSLHRNDRRRMARCASGRSLRVAVGLLWIRRCRHRGGPAPLVAPARADPRGIGGCPDSIARGASRDSGYIPGIARASGGAADDGGLCLRQCGGIHFPDLGSDLPFREIPSRLGGGGFLGRGRDPACQRGERPTLWDACRPFVAHDPGSADAGAGGRADDGILLCGAGRSCPDHGGADGCDGLLRPLQGGV